MRVIGDLRKLSEAFRAKVAELEQKSVQYSETTIWVALSYGGRSELVAACNQVLQDGQLVTEDSLSRCLWSAGMPDPDIIIRTGGEQRLSNFLPWQSVYSELYFTTTYWPAFTKDEFHRILEWYESRQRRHGR